MTAKTSQTLTTLEQLSQHWEHLATTYAPKMISALVIIIVFYLLAGVIRRLSHRFYLRVFKGQEQLASTLSFLIFAFLVAAGAFLALEMVGLESVLAKLLAGAGVIGIVIGFAVKDIAANGLAGFILNAQRPFKVGDWVELDGTFGTVQSIGAITTSIKTISGQEVFVPNQIIYSNTFTNYSTYRKRRVIFKTGVSYGDDLDRVKDVTLDEIKKIDVVLENEAIDFYFTDISSSAYNFEARFWIRFTHQKDYLHAMDEIIHRVHKRFEQEDFSIAYNVTTLDFGVKGGVNLFDDTVKLKQQL